MMLRLAQGTKPAWIALAASAVLLGAAWSVRAQTEPNASDAPRHRLSGLFQNVAWFQYHVLAIGVNQYKFLPDNKQLHGAANDATRIAELFKKQGTAVRAKTLLDEHATRHSVRKALSDLKNEVRPDDIVVIFLSGHGDRDGGNWYFAPYDYDPQNRAGTRVADRDILFSVDELIRRRHTVLLAVDACHAGQLRKAAESILNEKGPGGLILLAASVPSQFSQDGAENGVFTTALLEALSEGDQDGDENITLKELRSYLSRRMPKVIREIPKLPGLTWPEQDYVCEVSNSVSEMLVLTRGKENLLKKFAALSTTGPRLRVVASAKSPVGVWGLNTPYTRYTLELRQDGTYLARSEGRDGSQKAEGRYVYKPGEYFSLSYANGSDYLGIDSVTDNEMTIRVWSEGAPSWFVSRYTLRRQNTRKSPP